MEMDISPSSSSHEMLPLVTTFPDSNTCLDSMTVDAEQLPLSPKDDFTLNVNLASTEDTAERQGFSGNITMIVTARQQVTVNAQNLSPETIKAIAFREIGSVGVKLEAIDVVSVKPEQPELTRAMETLELGVYGKLSVESYL